MGASDAGGKPTFRAEQAHRFFSQQLADRTWRPEIARLAKKLAELKEDLGVGEATRRVKCTIEAATSDDLEAVLAHLKASKVPGLEVTKGATAASRSRNPRAATIYRPISASLFNRSRVTGSVIGKRKGCARSIHRGGSKEPPGPGNEEGAGRVFDT